MIKSTKLPDYVETLIITFLHILRSRALSRCHRYKDCQEEVEKLLENLELPQVPINADAETKMNCDAKQIVYAVVSIEYMKLMIKLRQYDTLAQLGEKIIKKC